MLRATLLLAVAGVAVAEDRQLLAPRHTAAERQLAGSKGGSSAPAPTSEPTPSPAPGSTPAPPPPPPEFCPTSPVSAPAPAPDSTGKMQYNVAWHILCDSDKQSREHDLIVCDKGESVKFTWTAGTHDLVHMDNEANYVGCNFDTATRLAGGDAEEFVFQCDTPGKHLLSCSVPGHCSIGNQKIQVQVVDFSQTQALRSELNASGNHNHYSYGQWAKEFLTGLPSSGYKFSSDSVASDAYSKLWCVQPHSLKSNANASEACLDFFIAADVGLHDGQFCQAIVQADLGFVLRKRPTPNFVEAESYYMRSLSDAADFCPAVSYAAGLYLDWHKSTASATNPKNSSIDLALAHAWYEKACASCGDLSQDMALLKRSYIAAQEKIPENSACATRVSGNYDFDYLPTGDADHTDQAMRMGGLLFAFGLSMHLTFGF